MGTERTVLYLQVETVQALAGYGLRHASRFPSRSAAADHLLRRALMGELDEGMEGVLAPMLVRAVRETLRREIADQTGPLIERQSQRLAGLLVQSGKDAHRAARIAEVVLGHLLADPARAARVVDEADLRAGTRYRRSTSQGQGPGRDVPPGTPSGQPGERR